MDAKAECTHFGHQWSEKTNWPVKVCMRCGTDELREAVKTLRYFQTLCKENKPVGQWPGHPLCAAIDVVLAALAKDGE